MQKRLIVIFVGIVFIIVGLYLLLVKTDLQKRCTVETEGTVIGITEEKKIPSGQPKEEGSYYELQKYYYPVFEYQVGDNVINKRHTVGDMKIKYRIGDKVTILYDPNKPEDYLVKDEKSYSVFGIVFIAAGGILFIAGIVSKQIK